MTRLLMIAGAGVLLASAAGPAMAQADPGSTVTTGDLAAYCSQADKSFCYGFMSGASQVYEALIESAELDVDPFVCPDGAVSRDEAVRVFTDWAEANPDAQAEMGIDGMFRALSAAYPCN